MIQKKKKKKKKFELQNASYRCELQNNKFWISFMQGYQLQSILIFTLLQTGAHLIFRGLCSDNR